MLGYSHNQGHSSQNLLPFEEWREYLSKRCVHEHQSSVVDGPGRLVEYETYELLRNPPNVRVTKDSVTKSTVVTIDSVNRPGTLVEVVTCLADLGVNVLKARISSDGGWFVDVFYLTEGNRKRVSQATTTLDMPQLQSTLQKLLAASVKEQELQLQQQQHGDGGVKEEENVSSTVFELSGGDCPGLLADITFFLTDNACDVRSAAVWTHNGRVAFVLSVTEMGQPIKDEIKLKALQKRMLEKMTEGRDKDASVVVSNVTGVVHHERRLHKLLLKQERKRWTQKRTSRSNDSVTDSEEEITTEKGSSPRAHSPSSTLVPDDMYRSPKACKPQIRVFQDKQRGYWFLQVVCKDRHKLFFDTVCTLSDLDYDIYHASIDEVNGVVSQEYYMKPRWGDGEFSEEKVAELKWMLDLSITRRHPKGMKIHVHSTEKVGCLAELTRVLYDSNLCITRAKAKSAVKEGVSDHTLYVMHVNGGPPQKETVERACENIGGKHVQFGEESKSNNGLRQGHKFSFSFLERWNRELGGSPSSYGVSY
eukprot:TRINITY_DN8634_c0_g1_i1.p2 TRINITY_DN8634_c0_g1~~TRINITY_DN8634_c0_g1_i1.p2  ORF type:complete len:534 (-),score=80.93 TRINITY_DN8634_c0_g1_i1:109-1710(-)